MEGHTIGPKREVLEKKHVVPIGRATPVERYNLRTKNVLYNHIYMALSQLPRNDVAVTEQRRTPVRMPSRELITIDPTDPFEIDLPISVYRAITDDDAPPARVLHVDDEPDFVDMAAIFLDRIQDRFTVETETKPTVALDRIEKEAFDCIISDYQMPVMDGLDLLDAVREEHPDVPFILCTARGSEEVASQAISRGVTDYIQKGTDTDQYEVLANRVQNAIDQYRTRHQLWDTLSWAQSFMEQDLVGVYVVQDETFVYVNDRFAQLVGHGTDELIACAPARIGLDDLLVETEGPTLVDADPAFEHEATPVVFQGQGALLGVAVEVTA